MSDVVEQTVAPGFVHVNGQAFAIAHIGRVFILEGTLYAEIGTIREIKPYNEKQYVVNNAISIKDVPAQQAFCKRIGVAWEKLESIQPKRSTKYQGKGGSYQESNDVAF